MDEHLQNPQDRFVPGEQITAMVDAVWAVILPMSRGDVISHQQIEQATELVRYAPGWGTVIEKLKRRSETERGITLWSETDVGYKLLSVNDQLNMVARKRQKKAAKQLRKAVRSLEVLPVQKLNIHQQNVRSLRLQHMRDARKVLLRQQRQQEVLFKRTDTGIPIRTSGS